MKQNLYLHEYLLMRYGKKLYQIAEHSPLSHRHAALVLDKRLEIICSGYNKYRNGQIKYSAQTRESDHAECVALEKYQRVYKPRGRKAYLLYTGRANGTGMTFGKPCDECNQKIKELGLKLEYTRYSK